jgi:hypothetical protein
LGITLKFSDDYGVRGTKVLINWYNSSDELISSETFYPDDTTYFCKNTVENYSGVELVFYETSLPYSRIKLNKILFGIIREFDKSETRSATLQEEGDSISNTVSTSTFSWVLNSRDDIDFIFQSKQQIDIYDGEDYLTSTYIKSGEQIGERLFNVDAEDIVGLLDLAKFYGKVYSDYPVKTAIEELLGDDFILYLDNSLENELLNGYISADVTKREALRQICFAIGACVTTMGTDGIAVFPVPTEGIKKLELDEIFQGQSVTTSDKVTAVRLTCHSIAEDTNGGIEIDGKKYTDTTTVYEKVNPTNVSSDRENIVEVTDMTLVSASNLDKLLEMCYNYNVIRQMMTATIILGDRKIGDLVNIPTLWGAEIVGNIYSMTIKLSNMTVADISVR